MSEEKKRYRWDSIIDRFDKNATLKGAEIGVFKGRLSRQLLSAMPNLTLYMVDRWATYNDDERSENPNSKILNYTMTVWRKIRKRAFRIAANFSPRAIVIKKHSRRAVRSFEDGQLDFVFIDADHAYQAVKYDIQLWMPKIKKGGYICGHDYTRQGVKKAVDEIFSNVELDADRTWFVKV